MARSYPKSGDMYWKMKRGVQWGRFGKKLGGVYDKPSVNSVAQAAWSGVKYLRTLVNSETHRLDTLINGTINATGSVTHLSAISQGDAVSQRTGNGLLLKYLLVRYQLTNAVLCLNATLRCIIFVDKQQVADTAPAVTDVLTASSTIAHLNPASVGRFTILKDYLIPLDQISHATYARKLYIDMSKRQLHVRFNGVNTTDIQKNGIYVLLVSSENTNPPTIAMQNRLAWHDN